MSISDYQNGFYYGTTGTVTVTPSYGSTWISGSTIDLSKYQQALGNINAGGWQVSIKAKSFLVIKRGAAQPTEVHDTADEALVAAKRLVAQHKDEFYVFSADKVVRPVPVEVEVVDA